MIRSGLIQLELYNIDITIDLHFKCFKSFTFFFWTCFHNNDVFFFIFSRCLKSMHLLEPVELSIVARAFDIHQSGYLAASLADFLARRRRHFTDEKTCFFVFFWINGHLRKKSDDNFHTGCLERKQFILRSHTFSDSPGWFDLGPSCDQSWISIGLWQYR